MERWETCCMNQRATKGSKILAINSVQSFVQGVGFTGDETGGRRGGETEAMVALAGAGAFLSDGGRRKGRCWDRSLFHDLKGGSGVHLPAEQGASPQHRQLGHQP